MRLPRFTASLVVLAILTLTSFQAFAEVDYDREIAPIFRSYCAGCHNAKEMEGEFSLETYADLREGGDKGDPIQPGKADDSRLIKVLEGRAKPKMPPKDEPQVPASALTKLKDWIREGAAGPVEDRSLFSHLEVPKLPASKSASPITAIAYSPDGTKRAIGRYGSIDIMAADSENVLWSLSDLPGKVNAVHFSSDGNELLLATGITGLKGIAQLWNLETQTQVAEFGEHRDMLYDAEISPDGQWIATASYDSVIHIWNKREKTLTHTLTAHQGAVFDLTFHPNSQVLASASADETVKLWRVKDGVRLDTLNQPQGELVSVQFTTTGEQVIAAGADKRLHLWDFVSKEAPGSNPIRHSRFAHESPITALQRMPDGKHLLSAAADRSLKVWSVPDLVELHSYPASSDIVTAFSPIPQQSAFVASRMDGSLETYELITSGDSIHEPQNVARVAKSTAGTTMEAVSMDEMEPNNTPEVAMVLALPVELHGNITSSEDADLYRFHAKAGQSLLLGIDAARSNSKLDSKIEVLDLQGQPIEQVRLQATRDSWLTFRGKDSETSGDFRVHNWAEMELNEYLYINGEVVQLWLYPRGPDSGYTVYPGTGKREMRFFTTALSHPLGAPCYIVKPLAPDSEIVPNGLPVYPVYWENDDDPLRRWGSDSQLWFDAPADGDYLVRITDVRGFGGEKDYHYSLTIRDRNPDFKISVGGKDAKVSPGSGKEITFTIERHEGFDGEVQINVENLPEGFTASAPVVIESGQRSAIGVLRASATAVDPSESDDQAVRLTARTQMGDREIVKDLGNLGNIQLGASPKATIEILTREGIAAESGKPLEFIIHPGETITARVRATRHDFEGRIEFGNEDSGRNLPHGLIIDNIGLNGLLIVEGQSEREFVITAAPWVAPASRSFHLRTKADGNQASASAIIHIVSASDSEM
ncbi:MAG: WD40 repeat protein [Verrucomicrobiales bacterium]|jgi:WD40 repeat protein